MNLIGVVMVAVAVAAIAALILTALQHRRHAARTERRYCSRCQAINPAPASFCARCGQAL